MLIEPMKYLKSSQYMYIYSNFQALYCTESVFKTKNTGKSRLPSRLFLNSIHKHSFGGLVGTMQLY